MGASEWIVWKEEKVVLFFAIFETRKDEGRIGSFGFIQVTTM